MAKPATQQEREERRQVVAVMLLGAPLRASDGGAARVQPQHHRLLHQGDSRGSVSRPSSRLRALHGRGTSQAGRPRHRSRTRRWKVRAGWSSEFKLDHGLSSALHRPVRSDSGTSHRRHRGHGRCRDSPNAVRSSNSLRASSTPLFRGPDDKLSLLKQLDDEIAAAEQKANVRWRADPVAWMEMDLDEFLWSKQADHRDGARQNASRCPACHGIGKTFTALTSPRGGSKPIQPTRSRWSRPLPPAPRCERSSGRKSSPARHRETARPCQSSEWWIGNRMVAFGRKPDDYNPEAFQGIHDRFVLVILDEAKDSHEPVDCGQVTGTSPESRILQLVILTIRPRSSRPSPSPAQVGRRFRSATRTRRTSAARRSPTSCAAFSSPSSGYRSSDETRRRFAELHLEGPGRVPGAV